MRAESALAWGPGVHTLAALTVLNEVTYTLPEIARIITAFPREFLYGSLAADFFVGKSRISEEDHLHNWDGGFRFLEESRDDWEASYAYGFLSHLAADVIAHNFFIPGLINSSQNRPRRGHIYWEILADHLLGSPYLKIANQVLSMDHAWCDERLFAMNGKSRNGFKAKKRIYTHSVKLSDYLYETQHLLFNGRAARRHSFHRYLASMVRTSCRLVRDLLNHPESSPCLLYDPMGRRNIRLAKRDRLLNRLFSMNRPSRRFSIDPQLLEL
jgi:hypothetical protein